MRRSGRRRAGRRGSRPRLALELEFVPRRRRLSAPTSGRTGFARASVCGHAALALELELVPTRDGGELQQRTAAVGMLVGELRVGVVPDDLERAALDLVIEPGAAEDELAEPVDERLAADERHPLPVAREVAAEARFRLLDHALRGERDEVGGLLLVELVCLDESELHGRCDDALLEIEGVEGEPVPEKLDDVVVA